MDLEKIMKLAKEHGGTVTVEGDRVLIDFETTQHERTVPTPDTPATEIHKEFDEQHASEEKKGYTPPKGTLTAQTTFTHWDDLKRAVEDSGIDSESIFVRDSNGTATLKDQYGITPTKELRQLNKTGGELDVSQLPQAVQDKITEELGYGMNEVRAFMHDGMIQVTDLEGNDIDRPRWETKTKETETWEEAIQAEQPVVNTDPVTDDDGFVLPDNVKDYQAHMNEVFKGIYSAIEENDEGKEESVYYPESMVELLSITLEPSIDGCSMEDLLDEAREIAISPQFVDDVVEYVMFEFNDYKKYPDMTSEELDTIEERIRFVMTVEADKEAIREFIHEQLPDDIDTIDMIVDSMLIKTAFDALNEVVNTVALLPYYTVAYVEAFIEAHSGTFEGSDPTTDEFIYSQLRKAVNSMIEFMQVLSVMCVEIGDSTWLFEDEDKVQPYIMELTRMGVDRVEEVANTMQPEFASYWKVIRAEIDKELSTDTDEKDSEADEKRAQFEETHANELTELWNSLEKSKILLNTNKIEPETTLFNGLSDNFYDTVVVNHVNSVLEVVSDIEKDLQTTTDSQVLDDKQYAVKKVAYYALLFGNLRVLSAIFNLADEDMKFMLVRAGMVLERVNDALTLLNDTEIDDDDEMSLFYANEIEENIAKLQMIKMKKEMESLVNGVRGFFTDGEDTATDSDEASQARSSNLALLMVAEDMLVTTDCLLVSLDKPTVETPTKEEVARKMLDREVEVPMTDSQKKVFKQLIENPGKELYDTLAENDKHAKEEAFNKGQELGLRLRDQMIAKEYEEGASNAEIMKAHGINSTGTLYSILRSQGVALKTKDGKPSKVAQRVAHVEQNQALLSELIDDYENGGLSLSKIYEKYSIHKNGLYYLLDKYNISRRTAK